MRRSRLRVRAGGDHKRGHRREKPLSLPHAVSTGAATKRVLDQLDGPFILVGHSYGASIMTVAGSDPKVKALVYVAPARPMPRIATANADGFHAIADPTRPAILDRLRQGPVRVKGCST
jgi:pimeloyl-ACP methyl ester carboxylesterase